MRRGSNGDLVALGEGRGADLLTPRGICGQRREVTVLFSVAQEREQDQSPQGHIAGSQGPADGAQQGCVRDGTGRTARLPEASSWSLSVRTNHTEGLCA